jgi:outer membrane protein OmpA-like peptidoglycan-associated protein
MRKRALFAALCSIGVGLGLGAEAGASEPTVDPGTNGAGVDTHLFRPAMDSKGFFYTNGSDILGHLSLSFGLIIDYGNNLLRTDRNIPQTTDAMGNPIASTTGALINHSFQGTGQINLGLFNHVVVGIDVPVNLMAGDIQPNVQGWRPVALDSQNMGFLGIHAKWRITRVERTVGLALGLQGGFTLTDSPRFAGADPGGFIWPMAIVEKRFGATGRLKTGLNAGFRIHPTSSTRFTELRTSWIQDDPGKPPKIGAMQDGQRFTYGFGVSFRAAPPLDLVLDTYGAINTGGGDFSLNFSHEITAGIKLFVERNSYLMLGGGTRLGTGFEAADGRALVGFVYEPSIGDRDGDGYKDDVDQCPDEPEDFDGFKDEDGCPDPDNDQDGILDVDDRCPNEPEDRDGDHDEDGCPEGNDGDRDGDGILDSKDKCPDDPEDRDGFQDSDGCPDPDNDQDGIPDKKDMCPNDPEDKDGFEDEDGCPDYDNDKDGIPDKADKCPGTDAELKANKDTKETYNDFEDDDGCPDKGNVIIQDNNLIILEKIKFRTNSAEILPESNKILDAVATTIIHHPEFTLIEVAGHADERAPDDYNLRLTQDRVNSVMAALLSRGVERSRLRAKGYGEYCPEDPGHNEAAWEKNRRVEFKIVKTKDGPTGVELGCQNARAHLVNPDPVPP